MHPLDLGGHEAILTCSLGEATGPEVSEDRNPVQMFSGTSGEALSDVGTGVSWMAGSPPMARLSGRTPWKSREASWNPLALSSPCLDLSLVL